MEMPGDIKNQQSKINNHQSHHGGWRPRPRSPRPFYVELALMWAERPSDWKYAAVAAGERLARALSHDSAQRM
jgi:hypothetical protein